MLKPNFHHNKTQSSVQDSKTFIENQIRSTGVCFGLFQLLKLNHFVVFHFIHLVCDLLSKCQNHSPSLQCHIMKCIEYAVVKYSEIFRPGISVIP